MRNPTLLVCRASLALAFLYQGLVPKLLGPHPDELALALALGIGHGHGVLLSRAAGVGEIALAVAMLLFQDQRWPFLVAALAMPVLLAYVAWAAPQLLLAAFNPVSTNIALAGLALVALQNLPRGRHRRAA